MLRGQMNERCPSLDDVPPHAPWLPGHSGTITLVRRHSRCPLDVAFSFSGDAAVPRVSRCQLAMRCQICPQLSWMIAGVQRGNGRSKNMAPDGDARCSGVQERRRDASVAT